MDTEQPQEPVAVLVVITDLGGPEKAIGVIKEDGQQVCMVDSTFLENNPVARESAFRAFMTLAMKAA